MRASMASRTARNSVKRSSSVPWTSSGSGNGQLSLVLITPGKVGQSGSVASQTVMI